jgi:hypothetical protein
MHLGLAEDIRCVQLLLVERIEECRSVGLLIELDGTVEAAARRVETGEQGGREGL